MAYKSIMGRDTGMSMPIGITCVGLRASPWRRAVGVSALVAHRRVLDVLFLVTGPER
jgi:hypothetical protein